MVLEAQLEMHSFQSPVQNALFLDTQLAPSQIPVGNSQCVIIVLKRLIEIIGDTLLRKSYWRYC